MLCLDPQISVAIVDKKLCKCTKSIFYTNMHCQDPQISVAEDSLIFKGMGGAEMQVGRSGNRDPGITQICNDIVVQTQTVYQANVSILYYNIIQIYMNNIPV